MSMELLTLLQLIYVIALYLGVIVLIPAAVFHGKFEDRPFYVRYTAYTCIGNFYVMNLVFLLQLLHISGRVTLILGIVIPALLAIAVFHWKDWVKASLVSAGETTHNVVVSTMGVRLFFSRIFQTFGQAVVNTVKAIAENISTRWFDWIGTIAIIVIVCWQYGSNLFKTYGYTASDMLVHNYWINAMGENDIFVAGVYPFGFHCIMYFFHAVFGIETFVILRVFSLLETLLIHFMLLFLMRLVCKTESASYIAMGFYVLLNIWGKNAYTRFYSALPQEYGMIFILPAIFFLILFFRERMDENGEKGVKGKQSTIMIKLFAINVSMTLAVHFYDTIALGIFCIAIAIAFCRVVFKKDFLSRIAYAGVAGLVIAILPMLLAYMGGKPLEGSLRWGMSVMNGYVEEENELISPENLDQSRLTIPEARGISQSQTAFYDVNHTVAPKAIAASLANPVTTLARQLSGYVFIGKSSSFGFITLILIVLGLILGGLLTWRGSQELGRFILAISINLALLCIVMLSRELGLPILMDKNRVSIYFGYFFIILLGLLIDRGLSLALVLFEGETMQKVVPTLLAAICFTFLGLAGWVRLPVTVEAFQKNGSIICLENILRENENGTFSVVSANDEMRMIEEYGYHYEVSNLLMLNRGENAQGYLVIPSSRVYVFIEKIPGVYDEPYEGSGKPISKKSAMQPLPYLAGFNMYKGQNRHIVMSKLYFWAQTFGKMYSNEISVYYEDDEFVCYEIRQSVDRPFDMSFDYGYNN